MSIVRSTTKVSGRSALAAFAAAFQFASGTNSREAFMVQDLNVRLGVQKVKVPCAQSANMSLAQSALKLL